jgi:hypothetical protein
MDIVSMLVADFDSRGLNLGGRRGSSGICPNLEFLWPRNSAGNKQAALITPAKNPSSDNVGVIELNWSPLGGHH